MVRFSAIFIFGLSYFIILIRSEKYIRFVTCDCLVNNQYINLTKCNLKALSRETVTTNVEFFLTKEVINATAHLAVFKRSSSGQFYPFLFNYWGNVCDAVKESPNVNFLIKQTKRIIQKFSNAARCHHIVIHFFFCITYESFSFLARSLLL